MTRRLLWPRPRPCILERASPTTFLCRDCGADTLEIGEYYMLADAVWSAAWRHGSRVAGMLCIRCVEARLGRRLRPADFSDARVNRDDTRRSERLRSRLGLVACEARP